MDLSIEKTDSGQEQKAKNISWAGFRVFSIMLEETFTRMRVFTALQTKYDATVTTVSFHAHLIETLTALAPAISRPPGTLLAPQLQPCLCIEGLDHRGVLVVHRVSVDYVFINHVHIRFMIITIKTKDNIM